MNVVWIEIAIITVAMVAFVIAGNWMLGPKEDLK